MIYIIPKRNSRLHGVGAQQHQRKKEEEKQVQVRRGKKRKGIAAERGKHPTPSRAIDALIGDEEQNGKQKKTKGKKQGVGPQPSYPGPFGYLLQPV